MPELIRWFVRLGLIVFGGVLVTEGLRTVIGGEEKVEVVPVRSASAALKGYVRVVGGEARLPESLSAHAIDGYVYVVVACPDADAGSVVVRTKPKDLGVVVARSGAKPGASVLGPFDPVGRVVDTKRWPEEARALVRRVGDAARVPVLGVHHGSKPLELPAAIVFLVIGVLLLFLVVRGFAKRRRAAAQQRVEPGGAPRPSAASASGVPPVSVTPSASGGLGDGFGDFARGAGKLIASVVVVGAIVGARNCDNVARVGGRSADNLFSSAKSAVKSAADEVGQAVGSVRRAVADGLGAFGKRAGERMDRAVEVALEQLGDPGHWLTAADVWSKVYAATDSLVLTLASAEVVRFERAQRSGSYDVVRKRSANGFRVEVRSGFERERTSVDEELPSKGEFDRLDVVPSNRGGTVTLARSTKTRSGWSSSTHRTRAEARRTAVSGLAGLDAGFGTYVYTEAGHTQLQQAIKRQIERDVVPALQKQLKHSKKRPFHADYQVLDVGETTITIDPTGVTLVDTKPTRVRVAVHFFR